MRRRHLQHWMRPSRRSPNFPFGLLGAKAQVQYQPMGVIGNIVPWNFPVYLAFGPLTGMLAAGNRAMIKMSEFVPHTAALVERLVASAFDETEVAVFQGGPEVGAAFGGAAVRPPVLHRQPEGRQAGDARRGREPDAGHAGAGRQVAGRRRPHGGPRAGREPRRLGQDVQQRAGLPRARLRAAAGRAPRRVRRGDRAAVTKMYPTMRDNPQYTSIINDLQFRRVRSYLDDARRRASRSSRSIRRRRTSATRRRARCRRRCCSIRPTTASSCRTRSSGRCCR